MKLLLLIIIVIVTVIITHSSSSSSTWKNVCVCTRAHTTVSSYADCGHRALRSLDCSNCEWGPLITAYSALGMHSDNKMC